ncbi:unnamed protein product [Allacma fusca]|uniref:Uncharacterized protein n=1 Tax=Allacma fusca TaxID=39272 RepID=A0A8J2PGA1_9HEXA|nr:unnamed protein product [Allacma fusca]
MKIWAAFIILLQIWGSHSELNGTELPCALSWAESSLANPEIPKNIIKLQSTGENSQYIIRGKFVGEEDYVVGRYDDREDIKTIFLPFFGNKDENSTMNSTFEFLINPNECYMEWAEDPSSHQMELQVSVQGDSTQVVGIHFTRNIWYPAHVDTSEGKAYVAVEEGIDGTEESPSYYVLLAFSKEIEMDLIDFIFPDETIGEQKDFVGMDEIHNDGPGEVSVTLTHEKNITETYSVTISKTWTTTRTETIRVGFWWWGRWVLQTYSNTRTEEETYTTTESNIFRVTQRVVVPAWTSIEACSVIKLSENKVMNYTAAVRYSARGADPEKILEVLKKEKIDAVIQDGEVRGKKLMEGQLKAAMALNTEFLVVPYGSGVEKCVVPTLGSKP